MRQFYLYKNSWGYYMAVMIDPVSGLKRGAKSTHTKDKVEAAVIASEWAKGGMPEAKSHSRAFLCPDSSSPKNVKSIVDGLSDSDAQLMLSMLSSKLGLTASVPPAPVSTQVPVQNSVPESGSVPASSPSPAAKPVAKKSDIKLCEFLINFWDYDNSEFIQRHIARGHSMSKKHAFCMHAFVKNYWRPYWGDDTTIEDLTKLELDDFFFYLYREKQLAGETVNKVINSASRCTRWLYENNKIKINPLFGIERFKAEHAGRDIPTEAEVRRLLQLDWENPMALMAFKLGAFCGLRAGEISGLRVCDVDVAEGMLHVRHSYSEVDGLKSTKNKDKRDLPIDNVTALQLMNHARLNPKFNELSYIFWSSKDPTKSTTPGYYADIFYLALEKIGISEAERKDRNIVFHSLRHFCATILAQRTDRNTVMTILGHRTEKVSEHYSDHDTKEKFDNMRNVMQAAWDKYLSA